MASIKVDRDTAILLKVNPKDWSGDIEGEIDRLLKGLDIPTDQYTKVTALVPSSQENRSATAALQTISHLELLQAASQWHSGNKLPPSELGVFRTRTGELAAAHPSLEQCLESVRGVLDGLLTKAHNHKTEPTEDSRKAVTLLVKYLKYAERALEQKVDDSWRNPEPVPLDIERRIRGTLGDSLIHQAVVVFCVENDFSVKKGEDLLGETVDIVSPRFKRNDRVEWTALPINQGRRYIKLTSSARISIKPDGVDEISYGIEMRRHHGRFGSISVKEAELEPLKPLEQLSEAELVQVCWNVGNPMAIGEIYCAIEILESSGHLFHVKILESILSSPGLHEDFKLNTRNTSGTRGSNEPGPYERAENNGRLLASLIKKGAPIDGEIGDSDTPVMHQLLTYSYPGASIKNVIDALLDRYKNDLKGIPHHPLLLLSVLAQKPSTGTMQLFEMYGDQFYVDFENDNLTKNFRDQLYDLFERLVGLGADVNASATYRNKEVTPIEMAYSKCQKWNPSWSVKAFASKISGRLLDLGAIVPERLYKEITDKSGQTEHRELDISLANAFADQNEARSSELLKAQLKSPESACAEHVQFLFDKGAAVEVSVLAQALDSCRNAAPAGKVDLLLMAILEVEYAKMKDLEPSERATQVLSALMMQDQDISSQFEVAHVSDVKILRAKAVDYLLAKGAQVDGKLIVGLKKYREFLDDGKERADYEVQGDLGKIIPALLIARAKEGIANGPEWMSRKDRLFQAITFFGKADARKQRNVPLRYVNYLLESGAVVSEDTNKIVEGMEANRQKSGEYSCMDYWLTPDDEFDIVAQVGAQYVMQVSKDLDPEKRALLVQQRSRPMELPEPEYGQSERIATRLKEMGALDVEVKEGKPVSFKAPMNWKVIDTDHTMHQHLVNVEGEVVLGIFYKRPMGLFGGVGERYTYAR